MKIVIDNAQILEGKKILDNAASNHAVHKLGELVSYKVRGDVSLSGVNGTSRGPIIMGTIRDEYNNKVIDNVIYTPGINYSISSEAKMLDEEGWKKDKSTGPREERYYRKEEDGTISVQIYKRNRNETHFVKINSLNTMTNEHERTMHKMIIIHINLGHMAPAMMLKLCDIYAESHLGYTKEEATLFLNNFNCYGCDAGKITARRKDGKNDLLFLEYYKFTNQEGLHIDVLFIKKKIAVLLARSHKYKKTWVKQIEVNYTGEEIKTCLLEILGDYKYAKKDISFIRSDGDGKFAAIKTWFESLGLRWYLSNTANLHASVAERAIRTLKDLVRTIYFTLEFTMPDEWLFYIINEANNLLDLRYHEKLKCNPREAFFGTKTNYKDQCWFHFGQCISYPGVKSKSNPQVPRVHYGIIVGRDMNTGNLLVENFLDKKIDFVSKYHKLIPIDNVIRQYFANYDSITGFDYSPNHSIIIAVEELKPNIPIGLQGARSTEVNIKYNNNDIEILSSSEYHTSWDADSNDAMNIEVSEATGSHCHESHNRHHEIPARIENIVIDTMRSMDISSTIVEELKQEGIGPIKPIENIFNKSNTNINVIIDVVQMNYREMYKLHPDKVKESSMKELKVISERDTIVGYHKDEIPNAGKIQYIMTKYTEKFKEGKFNKVKSRFLLGGDGLADKYASKWDELNARTISQSGLNTCAAVMAHLGMKTMTQDWANAFLYANLPLKDQCYAKIPKDESKLLIEIDSAKWKSFLNEDGHIYVKVKGALYGHPLAPKLWYDYIKEKLALLGIKPLESEQCIFVRNNNGKLTIACLHVDDLLIGTLDDSFEGELKQFIVEHFRGEGTLVVSNKLEYLNAMFIFDKEDRSVTVTQESYWQKVLNKYGVLEGEVSNMPHNSKFTDRLRNRNDDKGTEEEKLKFLSIVMSLLWGALRSQVSVLFNVTALASQSKYGTVDDYNDAMKVLKYINEHKSEGIRLKIKGKVQLAVFVDSSSNLHKDTRGHGGFVISLGDEGYGGPVETNSSRAKLNGRSSLEYELFSLHHMLPSILHLREVLEELGFHQEPIMVFEDSKSTIDLIRRGKVSSGTTRHIAAKYYYAKDLIARGIIQLRHCPTKLMIADILTKDLPSNIFRPLSKRLINSIEQDIDFNDEVYRKLYLNSTENVYDDISEEKCVKLLSAILERVMNEC